MKRLYYSLAALALVVLAACNKTEMPGFLSDPDAVRIEAAVGSLTKSNPLGTKEEQKTFNEDDRIAVTNSGKTVVYKLQNGTWAPENAGEYLKWDKSDLKFTAKCPADYSSLPSDQSTSEKLATADYMEGTADYTKDGIPGDRILSFEMKRQNVLVRIKIEKFLDQYKEGETYIKNLRFNNGVLFPLIQKETGEYVEGSYSMGTVGCTYTAILEPHSGAADAYFVEMIPHKANQDEPPLKVKGIPELKAGHAYTFNLYVGKNTVKIGSVSVNDWTTGVTLPEGETEPVDTWDGQTTEAFATQDAKGNDLGAAEDNPILISSCAQLAYLAQQVNDGYTYKDNYFKLTDDLNLAGKKWNPIGNMAGFSGHFDGDNHDILSLNVEGSQYYAGLFGRISDGGSVKNVNIRSGSVNPNGVDGHDSAAGGIVGYIDDGRIENCTASVNVSGKLNVGGLVGYIINGSVINCHFSGEINGGENVGGLCGWFGKGNSEFSKCIMEGTITVTGSNCGGLVGYLGVSSGKFDSCQFEGSIKKDGVGVSNTGIAIGKDESNVTFSECVCTIDSRTYTTLGGNEAGNKSDDYIGIEVKI